MPSSVAKYQPFDTGQGVAASPDATAWQSKQYIYSDKVRFDEVGPMKIGGWQSTDFDYSKQILGCTRSLFGATINGRVYTLYGTHKRLYAQIGTAITNITPIDLTTSFAIGANLTTSYDTLANDPVTTTNGSTTVTISDTDASRYRVGDNVTLSGVPGAVNGIPAGNLNATHVVRSIGSGTYDIIVATSATSSGSGGGAAVVRASGLVKCAYAAHGMADGDRVKFASAVAVGGVTAPQINLEFESRYFDANTFDIYTTGTATSLATGSGAATVFYKQIAAGALDQSLGQGYGMGRYGVGLYGVSKISTTAFTYPRIWMFDRYGDIILCSPGNQTGLYEWAGDTTTAPTLVTNAPTAINYFFVSNNIIVTFGASGTENRIKTSDQGSRTTWTATAENQVYDDNLEGAGRLASHLNVRGTNIIFTRQKAYTFEYIGLPNVWKIRELGADCGIIAQNARCEAMGVGYWMSGNNFMRYRGGNAEIVPSYNLTKSTINEYVFNDISTNQYLKAFCWYNPDYQEIRWHYPTADSNEPNKVACFYIPAQIWFPDTIDRTATEQPQKLFPYPRLTNYSTSTGYTTVYNHETGHDDDGEAMTFTLTTNRRSAGKNEARLSAIIPDSYQTGSLTVTIDAYQWPQATDTVTTKDYTVSSTEGRVNVTQNARYWTYTITGSDLGQDWRMGNWAEEVQISGDGA